MKMALIKRDPRHQIINNVKPANNQNRRKSPKKKRIETHLTIIGVCTTTLPEKSGT
jgi:hypothetical protein